MEAFIIKPSQKNEARGGTNKGGVHPGKLGQVLRLMRGMVVIGKGNEA